MWYNFGVCNRKGAFPLNEVTIKLIANAGVLVEYRGCRYLVDGIHTNDYLEFNGVPETLLGQMLCGSGELADIDYLLFTHEHIDHFSAGLTQTYLQNNMVRGIVVPAQGGGRLAGLKEYAEMTGVACIAPQIEDGQSVTLSLGEATLTIAGMRHMGAQFRDVQSCSFLLDFGGKTLLFTGDSDHIPLWFESALAGKRVDVIFVNPLFYLNNAGQHIIHKLAPQDVVVYHLAAVKDGVISPFQRAVQTAAERMGELPYRMTLLDRLGRTELF